MKPKSPDEYLSLTEFAIKHLYEGLNKCFNIYKEASKYWNISKLSDPLNEENNKLLDKYLLLNKQYIDLNYSENTFCGSILQVASIGIDYFSKNENIPNFLLGKVKQDNKKIPRFCIGKDLYEIPTGLIIYAGRNQYNHWNDPDYKAMNQLIFNNLNLTFYNNTENDLTFELSNPSITIYSKEILLKALKWENYDTYYKEMKELFDNYC